jgi:outer membrane scaffolding protein for murein synthesis (MipA/OmpV family)
MRRLPRALTFLVPLILAASLAQAQQADAPPAKIEATPSGKPLWEIGVGGVAVNGPDYPAAGTRHARVAPVPILVYRGERLRVDEDGVRSRLFAGGRLELDLSGAAAFNARDNDARRGMPGLDYLFELGPQLRWRLPLQDGQQISAHLKARAVFSTDGRGIDRHGSVVEPELRWQRRGWPDSESQVQLSVVSTWASESLHDYFYQVDPRYATAQRPAYDASAGYFGSGVRAWWSRRVAADTVLSLGASLNNHAGAANRASPLFERSSTASFAAALIWTPWKSEQRVP